MIKGFIEPNIILFGLTRKNLQELLNGVPTLIDMAEFGEGHVLIIQADTEEECKVRLNEWNQKIKDYPATALPPTRAD